jgi:phage shock protein A
MANDSASNEPKPQINPAGQRRWVVRDWATALIVSAFTLFVAFASVILLASTLTQTRLSGLTIDGLVVTVWKLNYVRQNWALIQQQIEKETEALAKAEIKRAETNALRSQASERVASASAQLERLNEQFNSRLSQFDPERARALNGKGPRDYWSQIETHRNEYEAQHSELNPLILSIATAYANWDPAQLEHEKADAAAKALTREIEELTTDLKSAQSSLDSVFSSIKEKPTEADKRKIESALYEIEPTDNWLGKIINKLVTEQPEILTLSLVICMGLLGASLNITNSVFREGETRNFGSYFLQVCVGAIAALVIFVVAKAGVPLVTDASKIGGDAPINPYFISFLAIISGLLSERAIASVQAQGGRFFGSEPPDEPRRWIKDDLSAEMQSQNLSAKALAAYLGMEEEGVESIVKGLQTADAEQQKVIAIYLRRNKRDIFTDMPPNALTAEAS